MVLWVVLLACPALCTCCPASQGSNPVTASTPSSLLTPASESLRFQTTLNLTPDLAQASHTPQPRTPRTHHTQISLYLVAPGRPLAGLARAVVKDSNDGPAPVYLDSDGVVGDNARRWVILHAHGC